MLCFCCAADVTTGRKAKARWYPHFDPARDGLGDAFAGYEEAMTYRWHWICEPCYGLLDNVNGVADISGRQFGLAGASRGNKARQLDEAAYCEFRQREAARAAAGTAGT